MRRRLAVLAAIAFGLALPSAPGAAPPEVPEAVVYQGVLLDDLGAPRTGSVDLTLRVFDAASSGTLLYTQVFAATPLSDGVFSVVLGPAGAASDTPVDPLTTALADVFAGDLAAVGPDRYLEVTVGAEGPLARTRLQATPFALRAGSAATADTATSVALVGGLPEDVFTQIYENTNLDGVGPPNTDAAEGLGDTDGDGVLNFVDPDNDDDGLDDGQEAAAGSDPNLVTPIVGEPFPTGALELTPTTLTVPGQNFAPGMTVTFGVEAPTPTQVTPTSFEVDLAGLNEDGPTPVTVTLPNGESGTDSYDFARVIPQIDAISPAVGIFFHPVTIEVTGSRFRPDLSPTLTFGTETPVPTLVEDDRIVFDSAGQGGGIVTLAVTLANGESDSIPFEFTDMPETLVSAVDAHLTVAVRGVGQTVVGGRDAYGTPASVESFPSHGDVDPGQLAVAFSPAGLLHGLRCRETGPASCDVELVRDDDDDLSLEAGEVVAVLESVTVSPVGIFAPNIVFDSLGRVALGYKVRAGENAYRVAYDRDGNGDFLGAQEFVTLSDVGGDERVGKLTLDPNDRVAVAVRRESLARVDVYYDRNGDGDFDDTVGGAPETSEIAGVLGLCAAPAFGAGDQLSVLVRNRLLTDANDDGDFDDAGEEQVLIPSGTAGCDMVRNPAGGLALGIVAFQSVRRLQDLDADGDFQGAAEDHTFSVSTSRLGIGIGTGSAVLAVGQDTIQLLY